jgi:hypothetical protein
MSTMRQRFQRAISARWRCLCALALVLTFGGCELGDANRPAAPERLQPEASGPERKAAEPTSAPATVGAPPTKLIVWALGSRLSLAALGYHQGASREAVDSVLTKARALAAEVGVEVPDLPRKTGRDSADAAAVLHYLLVETGQLIGRTIGERYGAEHAALFEVALKSNLLLLLYVPGGKEGAEIAAVLLQRGGKAALPARLWQPLIDKIGARATYPDLKQAVFRMHEEVARHLESAG